MYKIILWGLLFYSLINSQTIYNHYKGPDHSINCLVIDGNSIYYGGNFKYVGDASGYGAKLDITNAKADKLFPKINGTIYTVLADGNNGWFIGGDFSKAGNKKVYNFVKIDINGNIDNQWIKKFNGQINKLIKDGDYLYICGYFDSVENKKIRRLCRFNYATKQLDENYFLKDSTMFNFESFRIYENDLYILDLSRIYKLSKNSLVRDTNFIVYGFDRINDFEVSSNGLYYSISKYLYKCSRITGNKDYNFSPQFESTVRSIELKDNYVYAGGYFWYVNNQQRPCIARLQQTNGALTNWGGYTIEDVFDLFLASNHLYVYGDLKYLGGTYCPGFGRVSLSSGSGSSEWQPNITSRIFGVAESGNYVYIGGYSINVNNVFKKNICKIDKNTGNIDESFLGDFNNSIKDMKLDGNYLYVVGNFTQVKDYDIPYIARVNKSDGFPDNNWKFEVTTDNSWDYPEVKGIYIDGDYLYIYGKFSKINNVQAKTIAKINKNTKEVVPSWPTNFNGTIDGIQFYGNYIYLYGSIISIGNLTDKRIVRIRKDNGQIDYSWSVSFSGFLTAVVASDDFVYISGEFSEVNNVQANNFCRVSSVNAQVDQTFLNKFDFYYIDSYGYKINSSPRSMKIKNNILFTSGYFDYVNGHKCKIAAINLNTLRLEENYCFNTKGYNGNNGGDINFAFDNNLLFLYGFFSQINDVATPNIASIDISVTGEKHYEKNELEFAVSEVFPNPFNSTAKISFSLDKTYHCNISFYDILGRMLYNEQLGEYNAGNFNYYIDAEKLKISSGVYYLKIDFKDSESLIKSKTMRFIYLK